MPPMMPMSQTGFPGEQGKPLQAPNQGSTQKQGTYNPFEVPQQSNNPFFNFSNEVFFLIFSRLKY